jgi:hypothetical protein
MWKKKCPKIQTWKENYTKVQNVYSTYDLKSQCLKTFMSYSMGTNASAIGDMVYLYHFYLKFTFQRRQVICQLFTQQM